MKSSDFYFLVDQANERSMNVLYEKGEEYTTEDGDRLGQFKDSAKIKGCNPVQALMDQATKQFTSMLNMAKNPASFSLAAWHEKSGDLRNYTLLLEGLLVDLEVK